MNKFLFVLCAFACCCFSAESYGDEGFSRENMYKLLATDEDEDFDFLNKDNQTIAKFCGTYMFSENPGYSETDTTIILYKKERISGTIFHIAWYADGFIITQISGPKEGYQVVFLGNDIMSAEVIGVSYPSSQEGNGATNIYSWGQVWTYSGGQCVEMLNPLVE